MLRLKGCPRCSGDLHLYYDLDGLCWACIQCGYAAEAKLLGMLAPALMPMMNSTGSGAAQGR